MSSDGSFILLKCGTNEIWQKIVLFSFSGHPNGPKTTSHNKVVIMLFGGLDVLKITMLSLNSLISYPSPELQAKVFCMSKDVKKSRFLNFRGGGSGL